MSVRPLTPTFTLLAAVLLLLACPAYAGDDWMPPVRDATVQKECGTCHMTFQPGFLPARSWSRMMGSLSDHFGEDVTLPNDKIEIIRAYLTANAGDVVNQGRAAKYMHWVAPGGTQHESEQRGGRSFAVGASHRHRAGLFADPPQHLGT